LDGEDDLNVDLGIGVGHKEGRFTQSPRLGKLGWELFQRAQPP